MLTTLTPILSRQREREPFEGALLEQMPRESSTVDWGDRAADRNGHRTLKGIVIVTRGINAKR